jgi:anti-sigma factor RsiW
MTWDRPDAVPGDVDLVAYIDGELSPADSVRIGQRLATDPVLAARATLLMKGGRPFQTAFAPLLSGAPAERLDAMLNEVLDGSASPSRQPGAVVRRHPGVAVAAAILLLVAGAGLDHFVVTPFGAFVSETLDARSDSADWRRSVARYLALYRPDTLAGADTIGAGQSDRLADLGNKLGLRFTPARLDLPSLALKRADIYDYDGAPIVFLAYLDPKNGPVAFCITTGKGEDAQRRERRHGMNVVFWGQDGRRFMLIGHAPDAALQDMADTLERRFADARGDSG